MFLHKKYSNKLVGVIKMGCPRIVHIDVYSNTPRQTKVEHFENFLSDLLTQ